MSERRISRLVQLQRAWNNPELTVDEIKKQFKMSSATIYKLAREHNWPDRERSVNSVYPLRIITHGSIYDVPPMPKLAGIW